MRSKSAHLRLIREVDDLALGLALQRRESTADPLTAARCDHDGGTLALDRLCGGETDARRAAKNHHALFIQAHIHLPL
jgi:hypothetical protein